MARRALRFPGVDTSVVTIWTWVLPHVVGFVAGTLAERRYLDPARPLPGRLQAVWERAGTRR